MTSDHFAPPKDLDGLRSKAWIVAAVGIAASAAGWFTDSTQFYRSYLVAWLFWLGVSMGCYALAMLHQLTRGAWGLMIRRVLGAAMRIIPLLAILFIPIVLGIDKLYLWAQPGALDDPLIAHKAWYLNKTGFIGRAIFYFAVWYFFTWVLNRISLRQDKFQNDKLFRRMQKWAAPGLGLYCMTATFASVDWMMSLDPHWYSSLYGISFIGGHAVSALAFVVPMALWLSYREPMSQHFRPRHFHDYGKLMLAFVMLWTYFQLSQLIIVWSGNLPEEVTWYLNRLDGGWKYLTISMALFHFALPFVLLLSRDLKRDARRLAVVAFILLIMRWFDIYWQSAPAFSHGDDHGLHFHWLDLTTVMAVGGLWLGFYITELKKRPLLPAFEPFLKEALEDE